MDNNSEPSNISDSDLDNHIQDLQGKLRRLHISLDLAKAEKFRRSQTSLKKHSDSPNLDFSQADNSKKDITVGSKVKILNKYRGNRGKVGEVVTISGKTATVYIPQEGNFIKYLSNLKLITDQHAE